MGDSYTIGEGVAAAHRWPARLVALLREAGAAVEDPEIVARTGWTCEQLWAAIDAARPCGPYTLVSLLIGVNDQYGGATPAEYAPRFARLLARATEFAGGNARHVLVLSIPDWGMTPFANGRDRPAIAAAIDAFNDVIRTAVLAVGARFANVTDDSRRAGSELAMLAADGLHPAAPMYERWARLALPPAAEIVLG